jgi:predicted Zn finger-like uncharacterized protein
MILTCPECATSYFVDDARIPPRGRMVRCTSCGARWRALPDAETEPDETAPAEDDLVIEGPESGAETETEADAAAPAEDLMFAAPLTPTRAAAPRPKRTGMVIGAVAAAVVVVALAAVIALRQHVARAVPATAGAFAALGLPVDRLGLVIEGVTSTPTFEAGRPVLSVRGAVRNTRREAVEVPPIRVSLLDRAGKPVVTKVAAPIEPRTVPAGERRYFAIGLPDPPAGASELEVGFAPVAEAQGAHGPS